MAKSVTDLLETLEELGKDDLKRFKWKLKEIKVENQYNNIPWGKLETARPVDIAKELLNYYGEHYRVEVTIQVLRSIHRRDLADRLTTATQQESNMQQMPASFKSIVSYNPSFCTCS
uniref:Pyrin domain-containing protein n=1 Tax=Chelonoidis abingdonii TaxID=106734 RepID=A0A8C0J3W9_CHEAB